MGSTAIRAAYRCRDENFILDEIFDIAFLAMPIEGICEFFSPLVATATYSRNPKTVSKSTFRNEVHDGM